MPNSLDSRLCLQTTLLLLGNYFLYTGFRRPERYQLNFTKLLVVDFNSILG